MSGFLDNTYKFLRNFSTPTKLTALLTTITLLIFIGAPKQPYSVISAIKGLKSSTLEIDLPILRLSKKLSVSQCSNESINNVYSEDSDQK